MNAISQATSGFVPAPGNSTFAPLFDGPPSSISGPDASQGAMILQISGEIRGGTCPSPTLSGTERAAADRGDRLAFWTSRQERGDPLGGTAVAIVKNEGLNGQVANGRLYNALLERSLLRLEWPDDKKITAEMEQIGVELMREHADAVTRFGSPSPVDIARYHHEVFVRHGLDERTFGGTMLTGNLEEANVYSPIWRNCP